MNGKMATATNFGSLDWWIVGAFLAGITLAGLWTRDYVRSVEGYVVAGRRVRGYLGVATIIATEMGLVTVMYSAQKGFTGEQLHHQAIPTGTRPSRTPASPAQMESFTGSASRTR
jgi:hypothetical protein